MRNLSEVQESSAAAVDIYTEASGLLMMLRKHKFFETGRSLVKLFGVLKPANAKIQVQSVDLCSGGEVVCTSLQALREMRNESSLTNF